MGRAPDGFPKQSSRPPGATGFPSAGERPDRPATSISEPGGLVSAGTPAVAPHAGGLLQHGIRAQRGPADLLRRSRQRRGRSAQSRQRSRGASDRRRRVVSTGILPPGDRRRRQPGGAVPLQRSRPATDHRSEEHTSELQSHSDLVCRLLLEKKKKKKQNKPITPKKQPPCITC